MHILNRQILWAGFFIESNLIRINRMKKFVVIVLIVFLIACGNSKKSPDYVIPNSDMIEIFIDIHIADGIFSINQVRRELAKDSVNYYNSILEKYGYSRHDFDTSLFYYSKNINKYDEIYETVLNRLSEMETKLKEEAQSENQ